MIINYLIFLILSIYYLNIIHNYNIKYNNVNKFKYNMVDSS